MSIPKIAAGLGVLLAIAAVVVFIFRESAEDSLQVSSSNAAGTKGSINLALDSWIGYYPLQSVELKKRLRQKGYLLNVTDDEANIEERLEGLKRNTYDLAVITVDTQLAVGPDFDFPGVAVLVIDQSSGGDALVSTNQQVTNLDELKATQTQIAFTPLSPSEHLLKVMNAHFGVDWMQNGAYNWKLESNGAEDAYRMLSGDEAGVAVMWEPYVSMAKEDGAVVIFSSKDSNRSIVDLLLVSREFARDNRDIVEMFIANYFRVQKHYRDNPDSLIADYISDNKGYSEDQVKNMLAGVSWATLKENAEIWFSSSREILWETYDDTLGVLTDAGDFSSNPVPNGDFYRLMDSSFVEKMHTEGFTDFASGNDQSEMVDSLARSFDPLSESSWQNLDHFGTLKNRSIRFQASSKTLSDSARMVIDEIAEDLEKYPNKRFIIKGHTGLRGDKAKNVAASKTRAEGVSRYLEITYGVDPDRMLVLGVGSAEPLNKRGGESNSAFNRRLSRVTFELVGETY